MSPMAPPPDPRPRAADVTGPDERFAAHVGVRIVRDEAPPGGCWATATLPERPWSDGADGPGPVPTGAVLALIDATAWAAAAASLKSISNCFAFKPSSVANRTSVALSSDS